MSTHLLLNERPLQVLPTLAAIFGINEAIAIQQIHWVVTIKHEHEDDKTFYQNFMWCKYTLNQWQKKMPWLSSSSIYRLFKKLENEGLVKTCQPYTSSRDQTKWYRIDYKVFQVKSQNPSSQNDDLSSSQNDDLSSSQNDDLSSSQNDDLSSSQNDQMINTLKDLKNLKKKSLPCFFSDSLNQNQAMQQEENSADSANNERPIPPSPLSLDCDQFLCHFSIKPYFYKHLYIFEVSAWKNDAKFMGYITIGDTSKESKNIVADFALKPRKKLDGLLLMQTGFLENMGMQLLSNILRMPLHQKVSQSLSIPETVREWALKKTELNVSLYLTSPQEANQKIWDGIATIADSFTETLHFSTWIESSKEKMEVDMCAEICKSFVQTAISVKPKTSVGGSLVDSVSAPLSDAAIALKAKFEAKFDRKANKYEPHGLTSAGYGEWHLGEVKDGSKLDSYNNWKKSLIITAQNRKRLLHQPETVIAAAQYIRNTFERCKDKDYWADFESLIAEAIAYEQALASNPVLNQPQEAESPQTSTQVIPQVGEIDANGTRLVIDCRWSHFYPRSGRLAKKADGETQVFWDIESRHPPEPISDRLSKFFAEKLGNDLEKIKALLEAKHYAHESLKGYDYQVQMFVDQKSELVTAFNQEIEKLLHLQAA